jgi:hypothetical protein
VASGKRLYIKNQSISKFLPFIIGQERENARRRKEFRDQVMCDGDSN